MSRRHKNSFFNLEDIFGRTTFFRRAKDDSPKVLSTEEEVERSDRGAMDVILQANIYSKCNVIYKLPNSLSLLWGTNKL